MYIGRVRLTTKGALSGGKRPGLANPRSSGVE
jgi:hypothetical protein